MTHSQLTSRRQRHIETFLTRIPPDEWEEADRSAYPISSREWDEVVAADPDLEPQGDGTFRIRSHPEGEPLHYEGGWVAIRKDDSVAIAKMVELAGRLKAFVIDENGRVFDAVEGEAPADSTPATPPPGSVVVATEEERLVRRQMLLLSGILVAFAALTVLVFPPGDRPGAGPAAAVVGMGFALWAVFRTLRPRYYLQLDPQGRMSAIRRSTRSTRDTLLRVDLDRRKTGGIETIWHPLKYPGRTVIELQVRVQGYPWLVLLTTYREQTALVTMNRIAEKLGLAAHDLTDGPPARDVPRTYQLTRDEMKSASPAASWTIFLALTAAAAACFAFGSTAPFKVVGTVLGLLAASVPVGLLLKSSRGSAGKKYHRWLE